MSIVTPINITVAVAKAAASVIDQRRALVDEFGALDAELQPIKAKLRRHEELSKLIRSWYADADPEQSFTAKGIRYQAAIGAAELRTQLAVASDLYRALGHDKFLAVASVTLKSLEAVTDPSTLATLTSKKRSGARSLTVTPRRARR